MGLIPVKRRTSKEKNTKGLELSRQKKWGGKMGIQLMLVEDKRKMEIYNNGSLLTDYPLSSSELNLLKQKGVTDDIRKNLVTQICGINFMQIINNTINVVERNNNDDSDDMLFEFPHEN